MKRILWVFLLAALVQQVQAQQRAFLLVDSPSDSVLTNFYRTGEPGMIKVFETYRKAFEIGTVSVADTLNVWIQHYGPGQVIYGDALLADLIISCYPEMLPMQFRIKHVMPVADGLIYVYRIQGVVVVSNTRSVSLEAITDYLRSVRTNK